MNEKVSKEFSHIDGIYLNTAYSGPIPISAKQMALAALDQEMYPVDYQKPEWAGINENVRKLFAELLGANTQQISHNTSASEIISTVATGYPFEDGDLVVSMQGDFPANVVPWMTNESRFPFEHRLIDESVFENYETLSAGIPEKTRIINLSHIKFDTGRRLPILEIGKFCQEKDILFIVDSAQGFGSVGITAQELATIDVFTCPSYKWLLAPFGHAFGYFSKKALNLIKPTQGQLSARINSRDNNQLLNYTTETKPGAYHFDRGQSLDLVHLSILQFSLGWINEIGLDNIEKYNRQLALQLIEEIDSDLFELVTPKQQSHSIVCLRPKLASNQEIVAALKEKKIHVSPRQGNIRAAIHLFNTEKQISEFCHSLNQLAKP